ncbi:hypothetical protein J3E69DRAFT_85347 [Trichoderma sp. SZMC 28015]
MDMPMPFSSLRHHHLRGSHAHPFDRANHFSPITSPYLRSPITSPFLPSGRVPPAPAAAYTTTSMPNAPRVTCRTIPVEPGQLPAPATKLVITQVVQTSEDSQFWALITVGAFYDSEDRIIWSTEQFAAHVGTDSESDEEEASEAEAETGRETETEPEAEATLESTTTESTIEPSSPPVHSLATHQPPVSPRFRAHHPEPYWQHPISTYRGYNNHESAFSPSRALPLSHLRPHYHAHPHPCPHHFPHSYTHSYPHQPHIHYLAAPSFPAPSSPIGSPIGSPPAGWNPVFSGPVPGHWQASFQPSIGRWVHTWQPRPFEIPFR